MQHAMNTNDTLRCGGNLGWLRSGLSKDGLLTVGQLNDIGVTLQRWVVFLPSFTALPFSLSTLLAFWFRVGHLGHVWVASVDASTDRGEPRARRWLSGSESTEGKVHGRPPCVA